MSEVNQAYESRNLLKLLQLQFQAVAVDARAAATLADEKLRVINQTLRQQLRDLQDECVELEAMVRAEFRLEHYGAPTAPMLQKALNAAAAELRADIKFMRADLAAVKRGDGRLKGWLNEQRELMEGAGLLDEAMVQALLGMPKRRR